VEASRLWFTGLGGARISGWYVRPDRRGPFPGVVHYHGYTERGARPLEMYTLAAQGIAVLSMDCRGQDGDSPDIPPLDGGHQAGWLTRGLTDPHHYYYRYVFTDAVRAIDALVSREEVDQGRIGVTGASQGGGLALAAAGLSDRVSFVWADVPFLCDYRRAVELAPEPPYTEVAAFLRRHPNLQELAFQTLAYFDCANHAHRVACPATVTVGLLDPVCPPSTIFGTFGRLAAVDKELVVLPYHRHEITYEIQERRFTALLDRLRPSVSS
jgi:cephalosporin-C deacetylase